jgi:general secretion pathway protein K
VRLIAGHARRRAGGHGERGAALLAVLWFVAAVAGLAVGFAGLARGDWVLAATQVDAVRARALMREGLARTVVRLEARRGRPLPRAYTWALADGVVAVRIEPEAGKVDLNAADRPCSRRWRAR